MLLYVVVAAALTALWSRFIQRVAPAIALVLVLLPMLFTGRALFTGRVYAPVDLAFAYAPLQNDTIVPHDIALSDLYCQIIPWQKAVRYALAHREWPLWNPFILCGDILAAAAQPAVYDPFNLIALLLPLPHAITFGASITFFLAAFFTYAFARALGRGDLAAVSAGAIYMCGGMMAFFVAWPLGRTWAFLPLLLFGVRRVVREHGGAAGSQPAGLLLAALVLIILAGHPESLLHVVAVGVVYGIFEICITRNLRAILPATIAGVLALLLTAIYLLPFMEASSQTLEHEIRTQLYAPTSYEQLAPKETRAHRIGRTFRADYDGRPWRGTATPQWDPLSARAGNIAFALAFIALLLGRRKSETWFFFALGVICLGLTFGSWPFAHALHAVPLFDIAINERFAFAAVFAVAILASIALDAIDRRFAIAILALLLVERLIADGNIYPSLPAKMFYPPIGAIPKDGRIVGIGHTLIPNTSALYELEDVRGYEAMTNKRLTETYPLWSTFQRAWFNIVDDPSRPFLSFLNVATILDGTRVIRNERVLPRAFVPPRIRYERDGKQVIEAMKTATDFAQVAWIEAPQYEPQDAPNGPGRVSSASASAWSTCSGPSAMASGAGSSAGPGRPSHTRRNMVASTSMRHPCGAGPDQASQ